MLFIFLLILILILPLHRIPAPNHEISAGFWRYASRNADTRMRNPVQVQDEEEEKDED